MQKIIELVKEEVMDAINEYKNNADDHYDFWNEHIKYVYEESIKLAELYHADVDIVKLGSLLHDIALIKKVGERREHHINGAKLAREILDKYDLDEESEKRVLGCVYNHRSSKNSTNIEELCVCDADILAHFDNIPMLFNSAFNRCNISLGEVRDWMMEAFSKDYDDLSEQTKEIFKDKYELIKKIVIGD